MKTFWRSAWDCDEDGLMVARGPIRSSISAARADLFRFARSGIIFNGRIQHIVIQDSHAERIDFERCYTGYSDPQKTQ